jgi:hypothetical protein
MEDWKVLRISATDSCKCAEFSDAVGRAESAEAFDAGVTIGGVSGVEFVATTDPTHLRVVADGVVERKRKITGDAEDIWNTNIFEARKNMLNDRFRQGAS